MHMTDDVVTLSFNVGPNPTIEDVKRAMEHAAKESTEKNLTLFVAAITDATDKMQKGLAAIKRVVEDDLGLSPGEKVSMLERMEAAFGEAIKDDES
jgi:hypothetical protein